MLKKYRLREMITLAILMTAVATLVTWASWFYLTPTAIVEQSTETIIFKHPTSILFLAELDSSIISPRDLEHPNKYQYGSWTPTSDDILPVHGLLRDCFNNNTVQAQYPIPQEDVNAVRWGLWLRRYIFQYSGITVATKDQSRDHVIYVSAKPAQYLHPTYGGFVDGVYKEQWLETDFYNYFSRNNRTGGGTSYFEIKVDLDTGECFDFSHPGEF